MSIKLYSLPYKNTIIQLVTFVFSVRIAYKLTTITYFYLIRETGLLNSPALGGFVIFKVNIDKKEQISARDQAAASKEAGTCLGTRHRNHGLQFTALSEPTAHICGPRVNFKAREMKPPGKAMQSWKPGVPEQAGQSVW